MLEESQKVIRVFIGSPGGLDEERQRARDLVLELNRLHSDHWGCWIKLIGWEDTLPGNRRAQSLINKDLDRCHYFIGILWKRWGSPPDSKSSDYTSGFEEEFVRATKRCEQNLMKDMVLFFKNIDKDSEADPGEQLKKVISFRETCAANRQPFYKNFETVEDFVVLLREALTNIGWKESGLDSTLESNQNSINNNAHTVATRNGDTEHKFLFNSSQRDFLHHLLEKGDDWNETSPVEIARLRLLAASYRRHGNDDIFIGPHDANVIFADRNDVTLSENEIQHLADAGIMSLGSQNIPLWHWIKTLKFRDDFLFYIKFLAEFSISERGKKSLEILTASRIPFNEFITPDDQKDRLEHWLNISDPEFIEPLLKYLSINADVTSLPVLEEILNEISDDRKVKVVKCIVYIIAKSDPSAGLRRIIDENLSDVSEDCLGEIFRRHAQLPTPLLLEALKIETKALRFKIAETLYCRDALDCQLSEALLEDDDYRVRRIAALSLQTVKPLDDAQARKKLIKKNINSLNYFGSSRRGNDESEYEAFISSKLKQVPRKELRTLVQRSEFYETIPFEAYFAKPSKKDIEELRTYVDDGFESFVQQKIQTLNNELNRNNFSKYSLDLLEKNTKEKLLFIAGETLSQNNSAEDIDRLRNIADQMEGFSFKVIQYLSKQGEWQDIPRILGFENRYIYGQSILSASYGERHQAIGRCIYQIGRKRLSDTLQIEMNDRVLISLLNELTISEIKSLSEVEVLKLLNHENAEVRKVIASKCSISLTKARLKSLLSRYYTETGTYFYNSIYWMDLGVSMPKKIVRNIIEHYST